MMIRYDVMDTIPACDMALAVLKTRFHGLSMVKIYMFELEVHVVQRIKFKSTPQMNYYCNDNALSKPKLCQHHSHSLFYAPHELLTFNDLFNYLSKLFK